jgi:hypothetical protein
MARGGKTRHVAPEFGGDHLGRAARDPGNRVEPGECSGLRRGEALDVAVGGGDRLVEELDVAQEVFQHEAVMGRDAPGGRLPKAARLRRIRRWASSASSAGVPVPAISALSIARADTPSTSVTTLASLMFAVSRTFWTRFASRARSSISRLR